MDRQITTKIVVHHSVTPQNWSQAQTLKIVRESHQLRGLAYDGNPAYHVMIGHDWQALTRSLNSVGYHSGDAALNQISVAVCVVGNFNVDQLTEYQKTKLGDQLKNWMNQYELTKDDILIHRFVRSTACPGLNITKTLIDSLAGPEQIEVRSLFREIWKREAARGDELYFIKRYELGSIKSKSDMVTKMKFWYGVVYPNGQLSSDGDKRWQLEKQKVLG